MDRALGPARRFPGPPIAIPIVTIAAAIALLSLGTVPAAPVADAAAPALGLLAPANTYVVTTTAPFGAGSLGQAILDANANSGPDTITFASQVSGTIVLTGALPIIGGTLTIAGPGAGVLAVSGASLYRVFEIDLSGVVTITGLTVRDGRASANGGGINNLGTLILRGDTITGNVADAFGGGIYSQGTLTLADTSVMSNTAGDQGGGGIDCEKCAVIIERSTISHNRGGWAGGVVLLQSVFTITNVTLSGNQASHSSGAGALRVHSSEGHVVHSTIVTNTAATLSLSGLSLFATSLAMGRSIVAQNAGGGNVSTDGTFTSLGYNLTDSGAGTPFTAATDITGTNPMIGPLQDNGGATWTHALVRGSPAIDPGPGGAIPVTDQRGQPRDSAPDIGAYEMTPANCWAKVPQDWDLLTSHTSAIVQIAVDATAPGDVVQVGGYCGGVSARAALTQTLYVSKTLTVRGGYAPSAFPATPVAHWRFDEDSGMVAADTSGQGNHGRLVNGPTWSKPGVPAVPLNYSSLQFNGVNSRVEVTKSDGLRLTSGTVAAWFKTVPTSTEQVILADEKQHGSQVIWSYRLRVRPDGLLAFDFTTDNRSVIRERLCTNQRVDDNQWHHAAAVRNDVNATVKLYLDGGQCGSDLSYAGAIDNSDNPLWIGLSPYLGGRYPFKGLIDDVRIYASILSPAQVAALADGREPVPSTWLSPDTDTYPTVLDALGRGTGVVADGGATVNVTLENLTVQGGASTFAGGGVASLAALTLSNVKLLGNTALIGGGLFVGAGTADLRDVLISGNATPANPVLSVGAGIFNFGALTVTRSTISANSGGQGGGIASQSSLVLRDSTVSDNRALSGGGIVVGGGTAEIANSTIVYNTGTSVTTTSGIHQLAGSTVLRNSIVAQNAVTNNVKVDAGAFTSQGYNLTNSTAGVPFTSTTDITGADPLLAPLRWYGGGTPTHALLDGSPAFDAIPAGVNACGASATTDQRGYARPGTTGTSCDIGAYEHQSVCQARIDTGQTFDSGDAAAVQCAVDASPLSGTVKLAGVCAGVGPRAALAQTAYIDKSLILRGGYSAGDWATSSPASYPTVLDGAGRGRVIYLTGGTDAAVTLENLTVQGGFVFGSGGGVHDNLAALTMTGVIVRGNAAVAFPDWGGGLYVRGATASVSGSLIMSNTSSDGGGLYVGSGSDVLVRNTEISRNVARGRGGGLSLYSSRLQVVASTLSGNSAVIGGGIAASSQLTVTNSTISGNTATEALAGGGAMVADLYQVDLLNSTIASNSAANAGRSGLWLRGGEMRVQNSIVAGNGGTNNAVVSGGSFASLGHNLTNSSTGTPFNAPTDLINSDPLLGPLENNGGATWTHALLFGSPAIDAANDPFCPSKDQRGITRPVGAHCDIGAYEAPIFVSQTITFDLLADRMIGSPPFSVMATASSGLPVSFGADGVCTNRYFCPVNREVRRFHCDVLHAVLAEYPFHGLLLDLRDYPFYSVGAKEHMAPWCYCAACREDTLRDLGFDPATVNFSNERGMVERWREWQTKQMDEALEYIRTRSLKARSNLRVLGLLPTDSLSAQQRRRPLIHWKTWGERSLVEALILEGYPTQSEAFETQLENDLATLPKNLLLLPMLSRRIEIGSDFQEVLNKYPIPGFATRFDNWADDAFDPAERIAFDTAAFSVESDPLRSVCAIFRDLQDLGSPEQEFAAFLRDLSYTVLREDMELSLPRLMMVSENIKGLLELVQEGRLNFGEHQDRVIHDLDLAHRLTYLAFCDLKG